MTPDTQSRRPAATGIARAQMPSLIIGIIAMLLGIFVIGGAKPGFGNSVPNNEAYKP